MPVCFGNWTFFNLFALVKPNSQWNILLKYSMNFFPVNFAVNFTFVIIQSNPSTFVGWRKLAKIQYWEKKAVKLSIKWYVENWNFVQLPNIATATATTMFFSVIIFKIPGNFIQDSVWVDDDDDDKFLWWLCHFQCNQSG